MLFIIRRLCLRSDKPSSLSSLNTSFHRYQPLLNHFFSCSLCLFKRVKELSVPPEQDFLLLPKRLITPSFTIFHFFLSLSVRGNISPGFSGVLTFPELDRRAKTNPVALNLRRADRQEDGSSPSAALHYRRWINKLPSAVSSPLH